VSRVVPARVLAEPTFFHLLIVPPSKIESRTAE
jgi:hypothetical protein